MSEVALYWQCNAGLGLIRVVPDARYRKFSPAIRQGYRPLVVCCTCNKKPTV